MGKGGGGDLAPVTGTMIFIHIRRRKTTSWELRKRRPLFRKPFSFLLSKQGDLSDRGSHGGKKRKPAPPPNQKEDEKGEKGESWFGGHQ